MKTYIITVKSRYHKLEGKRRFKVTAHSKREAWDKLKYEILCTDEYIKVSCELIN